MTLRNVQNALRAFSAETTRRFPWLKRPVAILVVVGAAFVAMLANAVITVSVEQGMTREQAAETLAPASSAAAVAPAANVVVEVLRLHRDARYYNPPGLRSAIGSNLRVRYMRPEFAEAVGERSCYRPNNMTYAYVLSHLLMRAENGDIDAARRMAASVAAEAARPRSREAPRDRASHYFNLIDYSFGNADAVSRAAVEMLAERDASYFPPLTGGVPADAGAVFDIVLRNTGEGTAVIAGAWFETVSLELEGTGQGGSETLNGYPLETIASLNFSTTDTDPVVSRDPIVIPPGGVVRFSINVDPYPGDDDGPYYVSAWAGRVHFNGGNGPLVATETFCTILPIPPGEEFS